MGTSTISGSDFSYLTTSKGRWVKSDGNYEYEYFLKDHPDKSGQALGNTRVVFSDVDGNGSIYPDSTEVPLSRRSLAKRNYTLLL
jgi:hypothetical protein